MRSTPTLPSRWKRSSVRTTAAVDAASVTAALSCRAVIGPKRAPASRCEYVANPKRCRYQGADRFEETTTRSLKLNLRPEGICTDQPCPSSRPTAQISPTFAITSRSPLRCKRRNRLFVAHPCATPFGVKAMRGRPRRTAVSSIVTLSSPTMDWAASISTGHAARPHWHGRQTAAGQSDRTNLQSRGTFRVPSTVVYVPFVFQFQGAMQLSASGDPREGDQQANRQDLQRDEGQQ